MRSSFQQLEVKQRMQGKFGHMLSYFGTESVQLQMYWHKNILFHCTTLKNGRAIFTQTSNDGPSNSSEPSYILFKLRIHIRLRRQHLSEKGNLS